jgi:cobalt-zinc-cadmium efflux system outer membrane protein
MLSDLEIGVAAEREDDGQWHVGPSVSLQVPIFDQGQAKKAGAASDLRRVLQNYAATAVEVRSAARAARDRLTLARRQAEFHRDAVLPLNEKLVHQSQLEYNAMQIGVFQLLSAKRGQIDAGAAYIESLRDYWQARAQLDLLLAGRMTTSSPSSMHEALTRSSRTDSREGH